MNERITVRLSPGQISTLRSYAKDLSITFSAALREHLVFVFLHDGNQYSEVHQHQPDHILFPFHNVHNIQTLGFHRSYFGFLLFKAGFMNIANKEIFITGGYFILLTDPNSLPTYHTQFCH